MKKIITVLSLALAITTGLLVHNYMSTETIDYEVYDTNGNIIIQGTTEIKQQSEVINKVKDFGESIESFGDDVCNVAGNGIESFIYWVGDTVDNTKELVLRMFD